MDLNYFIDRLSKNCAVFESLFRNTPLAQVRWRPQPDKWSMLEVVNHLYDEEREDFRQRLELVLRNPSEVWPPIDPRSWVTTRRYNERDPGASLDNFLSERQKSLAWFEQLSEPNWENFQERPDGPLSAGDLLGSWLAHDFLHIRQLARLHWQYIHSIAEPYHTTYAGPWKES